jgi:hypothetical protein
MIFIINKKYKYWRVLLHYVNFLFFHIDMDTCVTYSGTIIQIYTDGHGFQ